MSWLKDLFRKKEVPKDILCISCKKPVKFPEHLAAWQRNSWAETAICDDCQLSHWERKREEKERQEQEFIDRIAEVLAKKLRDHELA